MYKRQLESACEQWRAEGWGWVEPNLGAGRVDGIASTRLYPEWRDPTPEEQAQLERISVAIEAIDAELNVSGTDDDPRWSQRDDLEAAYETIRQAGRYWPAELKELGGVLISIDHEGEVSATEGLVRSEDQKRVDAFLKRRRAGEVETCESHSVGDVVETRASQLPKSVNHDLTLARTRAIRLALSRDRDAALALCVASFALRLAQHTEMTGVAISAHRRDIEDLPDLEDVRTSIEGRLPHDASDLLEWAFDQSRERLLDVLAAFVAETIDLTHEDASLADQHKQIVAEQLSRRLDIDMTQFWKADLAFWIRLPKETLIGAFAESPDMIEKSARTRDDLLKAHRKLRKDDLAAKVSSAFEGSGYLPDILVTPPSAGALAVTPNGLAELARVAVVAAE